MTDDLRYPVGRFRSVGRPLSFDERAARMDVIAAHPARMIEALSGLDGSQLDTPYRDGGWTVRQLVHHLADSHLNSYIRFRMAVTEENPRICTYDQDSWAELDDARTGPVEPSLGILGGLHARWVAFLRALPPEAFARTVDHPELGEVTVDRLLEVYAWHCAHHEGHVTALRRRVGW